MLLQSINFTLFLVLHNFELLLMEYFLGVVSAVVIALSAAILLVILILLHYCEKYRKVKKFSKLLRMLGSPKAEGAPFNELDYAKKESWDEGEIGTITSK